MRGLIRCSLLIVLVAAAAAAQTPTPATPAEPSQTENSVKPGQPGTLDAAAISYGAKLQEQASPALKKWAKGYAKKKMRKSVLDPVAIRAAVDAQYPGAGETARSAAVYFLLYTAYQDQYKNLAAIEGHVRGVTRSGDPFRARSSTMPGGTGLQRYSGSTVNEQTGRLTPALGSPGAGSAYLFSSNLHPTGEFFVPVRMDTPRMRDYVSGLRKRVDEYGRLLSEAHQQMKSTPPDVLREIP